MFFLQTKTRFLFAVSGEAPFGNIFLHSVILPNPLSFISSFARWVSGLIQSSEWNTFLACSPVLLSKTETVCLTQYDVRSVQQDTITLGQLLGSTVCLVFMTADEVWHLNAVWKVPLSIYKNSQEFRSLLYIFFFFERNGVGGEVVGVQVKSD